MESIEILRPNIRSGDFGNGIIIDPIEPISIGDINIDRGSGFLVKVNGLTARGASNFKIEKLRINLPKNVVEVIVTVPKIEAVGRYRSNIVLGIIKLNGNGAFHANIGELTMKIIGAN